MLKIVLFLSSLHLPTSSETLMFVHSPEASLSLSHQFSPIGENSSSRTPSPRSNASSLSNTPIHTHHTRSPPLPPSSTYSSLSTSSSRSLPHRRRKLLFPALSNNGGEREGKEEGGGEMRERSSEVLNGRNLLSPDEYSVQVSNVFGKCKRIVSIESHILSLSRSPPFSLLSSPSSHQSRPHRPPLSLPSFPQPNFPPPL